MGSAKNAKIWIFTAGVVSLIYLLSVGPAYKLHAEGKMSQSAFLRVYSPVLFLRDAAPSLCRHSFDCYMRLWHDYNKPKAPAAASTTEAQH